MPRSRDESPSWSLERRAYLTAPMTLRRGSASASPRSVRDAATIVAWTPRGRDQEQMLVTALGAEHHLRCCPTEHELWEALAGPDVRVLVLELTVEGRPKPASLIAAVRNRYAAIRIVGYGWLTQSLAAEVLACARHGLDRIALQGFGDLGAEIRRTLSECKVAEEVVLHDLQKLLPPGLIEMVRVLLQRLDEAPHLDQLSRLLGLSSRTLQRTASQEGCCPPSDLICAVRVLVAVRLLVLESQPMAQVLSRTGFQSTRALRVALARCGLASLKGLRGSAGYAGARDAILRFVKPRENARAGAPKPIRLDSHGARATIRRRSAALR
jgi:AraC-like DNA-binding protein